MSLDGHFTGTLFRYDTVRPAGVKQEAATPAIHSGKIPTFAVRRDSSLGRWWSSLKAVCAPVKFSAVDASRSIFRYARSRKQYFRGSSVSTSFVLHCVAIFLLIFLPRVILTDEPEILAAPTKIEKIYYLPLPKKEVHAAAGPVARETGSKGEAPAAAAAAAAKSEFATPKQSHPRVASRSSRPATPSDVILQNSEVQLAELQPVNIPKPQIQFNASNAKPVLSARQTSTGTAPSITSANVPAGVMSSLSNAAPSPLPMGGASGQIGTRRNINGNGNGSIQAPEIGNGSGSISVDTGNVLSLAVDPGAPSGAGLSGSGGPGKGEGGSSVSSTDRVGRPDGYGNGYGGMGGTLPGEMAMSMVVAVPQSFTLRKNALIVSAGPLGGGGLAVYKVLNCEKIYTIFLSMPAKNWTMQYCPEVSGTPQTTVESGTTVVHLSEGIVPPQPETQFDFRRLLVPAEKMHQTMILKGTLRADGTIGQVEVYQGIMPQMDEAARAALSRWRFKPAMRENKAIPVRILVGIPMDSATPAR